MKGLPPQATSKVLVSYRASTLAPFSRVGAVSFLSLELHLFNPLYTHHWKSATPTAAPKTSPYHVLFSFFAFRFSFFVFAFASRSVPLLLVNITEGQKSNSNIQSCITVRLQGRASSLVSGTVPHLTAMQPLTSSSR